MGRSLWAFIAPVLVWCNDRLVAIFHFKSPSPCPIRKRGKLFRIVHGSLIGVRPYMCDCASRYWIGEADGGVGKDLLLAIMDP